MTPTVPAASKPTPKVQHVKGTSVEDILENDYETAQQRHDIVEQLIGVGDQAPLPPGPPRKKELVDSYIRKPKYSVRRVALLCEWINSLHIWPNSVNVLSLAKEMINGVLLARIVKVLNPEVQFVQLNEKALAKKAAIENLEQALGHIWRSKSLNNSRIPTAEEIYNGNSSKIAILLNELFGVYVQRPLFKNAIKILRWFNHIVKQYQRPIPDFVLEEGDLSGVWPHFQSGTALFCVLYHFFGTTTVGRGAQERRLDPLRVAGDPTSICEFRDNLTYAFELLSLIGIEVLWTAEDWITNPDTEFIMLQLSFIFEKLKLHQCALPPAQGDKPGLTSGPNGEALVVGLIFSDAPAKLKYVAKTKKAVRLGYDRNSMPLLPVERMVKNPRFSAHGFLPRGMITKDVKIGQVQLKLKESKAYDERGDWNPRTTVRTDKERDTGAHSVNLLRDQHRRSVDNQADLASQSGNISVSGADYLAARRTKQRESSNSMQASALETESSTFNFDDVNKEIAVLVKSLEDEMISAQKEIQTIEEVLGSRYMSLEAAAHSCSSDEYSRAFETLEKERLELEDEKQRLKDYFARKLALIKDRKEDVHKKAQELKKISQSGIPVTPLNQDPSLAMSKNATSRGTRMKEKIPKDVKQAEKGWIKLSAKAQTHNFHLRTKQELSSAAFQVRQFSKVMQYRFVMHFGRTG